MVALVAAVMVTAMSGAAEEVVGRGDGGGKPPTAGADQAGCESAWSRGGGGGGSGETSRKLRVRPAMGAAPCVVPPFTSANRNAPIFWQQFFSRHCFLRYACSTGFSTESFDFDDFRASLPDTRSIVTGVPTVHVSTPIRTRASARSAARSQRGAAGADTSRSGPLPCGSTCTARRPPARRSPPVQLRHEQPRVGLHVVVLTPAHPPGVGVGAAACVRLNHRLALRSDRTKLSPRSPEQLAIPAG